MPAAFCANDAARLLRPSRPTSARARRPHVRVRPLRLPPSSACCYSWYVLRDRASRSTRSRKHRRCLRSSQCERLRASPAPNACACVVECRMERQGSTAPSMIGVVQEFLHVASAVLFPSDAFVACLAGAHTCPSPHVGRPKHTPALIVTHGTGSVSFCMRACACVFACRRLYSHLQLRPCCW
jgi:hypothetical protein